jgi:hypothetical protein
MSIHPDGKLKTMDNEARKAASAAWKERKVVAGIYAIHCAASGEVWVGAAPDLATIQSRIWFTLRQGGSAHRSLQAAWKAHGADAFRFEIVERLPEEELAYVRDRQLRGCLERQAAQLGATRI